MARLLFLGASVSQLPCIRYAREAGHEVIACDGDAGAIAFKYCHAWHVVDFSDSDRVAAVARAQHVDGILAVCTDRAVIPAAVVAQRLGLPGIGPDVARAMTHKPTMRRTLADAGVPQPAHAALTEHAGSVEGIPFPAVLKPADSGGQRGLYLIERDEELAERLPQTLVFSVGGEAMLEEYVVGTELNALIAVRDGEPTLLTLSDRLRPAGPGFGVGWIHSFPSSLPGDVLDRVRDVAYDAVRALGLQNGIAFPQLIATPEGRVVVVEVAARIAAGQMADLVRHGTGIELYEIAIAQAL
ncbi:MAG TPA: ATP-grasp domain-containing protein, partial [Gaiellaceae bacterium]|nr:ATP-grasp domain-containing protein [Gaiellaceae bacterium]